MSNTSNECRVLVAVAITFWIVGTVAALASGVARAEELHCPATSTLEPYGPADSHSVAIVQPNSPWAYVVLLSPDGHITTYPNHLIGPFTSTTSGQWWVCFTTDIARFLDETGWFIDTTVTPPTTIPAVDPCAGTTGIPMADGTCMTEERYDDTFSPEALDTVDSLTFPGRSVTDVYRLALSDTRAALRPRHLNEHTYPPFHLIVGMENPQ